MLRLVGAVLVFLHVVHLFGDVHESAHSRASLLFTTLGPLATAVLFLAATGWVLRTELGRDRVETLVRWTFVGVTAVGGLGVLTVFYLRAEGLDLEQWWYLVANAATGGAFVGLLVGVYDARAARTAARLRSERRRAEWLSQRLHVLNRVLRHDLRNELNVVHGYASLIAEGEGDVRNRAAVIERKSEEILRLSEKARDLERLLAESDDVTAVQSDLAAVVRENLDALRTDRPEVDVTVDVPDEASVSSVPLLDAVVDAVVENAVVHNPSSEPTVSVAVRVSSETVRLRVEDDGPGIPEEELDVLDAGVETPLRHSSGLGLWFVQWAVAESGGRLEFESLAVGTAVLVTLPRADAADAADSPATATPDDEDPFSAWGTNPGI
ncbi:Signal transduction histidine kinase [Halopelagius inordinatus]|uniref:histidine kinase n=2 Tax=Halopelagius inordinatus TaxID=553467 RepID=A0A1I2M8V6_9EURY|nr:Signal transduction histidine kinase [Halopelagius inordinatus]